MPAIDWKDAQTRLEELITSPPLGEEILILKDNTPVARLVPLIPSTRPRPKFGSARGKIQMAEDFDVPLEEFRE
jgi:antitoxin (DNA-binding transcriptional repressor) of toxin-antitoxin stability system